MTGQARDHKHGGNGKPSGMHPNLGNPSELTKTAATREETTPDIKDEIGQTSTILGRAKQIDLEAQSEEGELMQCNVPGIEGKVASVINIAPLLTSALYGKIRHVHETIDGTSGDGGDKNTSGLVNIGNHATLTTKKPTWTRMSRPHAYEDMDKQRGQRQIVGLKRAFNESNVTLEPDSLRNEKKTKPSKPNLPTVEAAM